MLKFSDDLKNVKTILNSFDVNIVLKYANTSILFVQLQPSCGC